MIQRNDDALHFLTVLGLGHARPASGTWGSLPPVALAVGLGLAGINPASAIWIASMAAVVLVFSFACVAFGEDAEARWGRDPSPVVADETAGMALVLMLFPAVIDPAAPSFYLWLLAAFILFRLADIRKPWPANDLQSLPAGWGILLDDLAAAIHAAVPIILLSLLFA